MSSFVETETQNKESMHPTSPKKSSWVPGCLIGCGVVVLVCVAICGGLIYYGISQGPILVADGIAQAIEESELPEEEKREIVHQINRIKDAYREGDITLQDFGTMAKEFAQSPLMAMVMIFAAEEKYIKPSGLTDEEKSDARRILARVGRGVVEEKIGEADMSDAINMITTAKGPNNRELKDSLTDEELKEFIAECKSVVDKHQIPDEDFEVKISSELKKVVDKALGQ